MDEGLVASEARSRGLLIDGLSALRAAGTREVRSSPAMVMGYGAPTPGQYEAALSLVVESVRAVARRAGLA
jgi:GntR family transcriptional regulator/MocR family aminotransferase